MATREIKRLRFHKTVFLPTFNGGPQANFNLEDVVDGRLLIFPDLPKDLDRVLKQDVFLSMVSAESVAVSRKYRN